MGTHWVNGGAGIMQAAKDGPRAGSSPGWRPGFVPRREVTHVVFDFDGTLSWLRHGWPSVMCRLFREVVSTRPGESERDLNEFLLNEILALNGKSSIHQMQRCVELARERGGAPPAAEALLEEYQRRLDAAIAERTAQIRAGGAQADDYVVSGARALLGLLAGRGLVLIISSGTRQERVKEEADLLGLSGFFGGHIYGSTADALRSEKRAVLERLMKDENISGEHLLAFGDGPVEIALTKSAGGAAVGVASDEEVNGSGRMDPHKSAQLWAAGADLLIPDYRGPEALLHSLLDS